MRHRPFTGPFAWIVMLAVVCPVIAQEPSSSALISQALDKQVDRLNVQGGLLDVTRQIEIQTGVRVEATRAVYDALPWGPDTSISVNMRNMTLRQALDDIAQHLGLVVTLGNEAVILQPTPALRRLGRRATLAEIQSLDLLASTPLSPPGAAMTVGQVLSAVDQKLMDAQSTFSIEDRAFDAQTSQKTLNVPRNATLMDAMDLISDQTDGTWYPWGHNIVVVAKAEATRQLLSKRIMLRFRDAPLQQVLLDLQAQSGTTFQMSPGALQQVPAAYSRVTLVLEDASIDQALQSISGVTGLKFTPAADGVDVTFAGPATQPIP
jgi:hypothetical protein